MPGLHQEEFILDWTARYILKLRTISRDGWDHFFPDLSQGEGLIDTIIITQSLSVLIVIADSGLSGFNWALWGRVSLLAMGMTLLSAV